MNGLANCGSVCNDNNLTGTPAMWAERRFPGTRRNRFFLWEELGEELSSSERARWKRYITAGMGANGGERRKGKGGQERRRWKGGAKEHFLTVARSWLPSGGPWA